MKSNKRPSSTAVITAEYRLLNALVKNKDFLNDIRVSENLFTDEVAKSLYEAISNLHTANIEITNASLLQAGTEIDFNVNKSIVDTIIGIDSKGASSLEDILPPLETARLKQDFTYKLEDIKNLISVPGNLDKEELRRQLYELDKTIDNSLAGNSSLKTFEEWSNDYIQDLEERKQGRKYSYGDIFLDEYFFKGAYPGAITIIAANTSMGKSTYVLSLIDNLLERNIPCMYFSLEMSGVSTYDRLISSRREISSEELYNTASIDNIIGEVKKEIEDLKDRKLFRFCEETDIDIPKLRKYIREFKQQTKSEYALVAIDLLTQMKNFMSSSNGSSTATSMEIAMNSLNALAKEENVHIIGVVQFKRDSDSIKIHSVEEIDLLRPTLTDIKNSGAIAERARVVLSVFRKKYYSDRYLLPFNVPGSEDIEDIMEIQVLKNSEGKGAGKIFKYMFDTQYFKLLPITSEDDKKKEILANIINL